MPKNLPTTVDQSALCFKADAPKFADDTASFSGTAYSGGLITNHGYWDAVVFDLDSMTMQAPIAALLDHRTDQRAGVIEAFTKDATSGLQVSGKLLGNEHGQAVQEDGRGGFPWQMSVRIVPKRIEEHYQPVLVNGRVFEATESRPVVVFRDSEIYEISFVTLGADSNTSAKVFQQDKQFNLIKSVINEGAMNLEDDNKRLQKELDDMRTKFAADTAAKDAALKQAMDALQQSAKKERDSSVASLFTEVGVTASDDEKTAFAAMDATAFNAASALLRKVAKTGKREDLTNAYDFAGDSKDMDTRSAALSALDAALGLGGK